MLMLLCTSNLKCKSFTQEWALDSLRIISMLGHLKTLRLPSCTAPNYNIIQHSILEQQRNSLLFNAYFSEEWKHCNSAMKKI